MNNPDSYKKDTSAKTALGWVIFFAVVAAIIGGTIYVFTNYPDIASNVVLAAGIIIGAIILIIVAVIVLLMVVLAPYYVLKGSKHQDQMSYSLDDVESVKETSSEENKPH